MRFIDQDKVELNAVLTRWAKENQPELLQATREEWHAELRLLEGLTVDESIEILKTRGWDVNDLLIQALNSVIYARKKEDYTLSFMEEHFERVTGLIASKLWCPCCAANSDVEDKSMLDNWKIRRQHQDENNEVWVHYFECRHCHAVQMFNLWEDEVKNEGIYR